VRNACMEKRRSWSLNSIRTHELITTTYCSQICQNHPLLWRFPSCLRELNFARIIFRVANRSIIMAHTKFAWSRCSFIGTVGRPGVWIHVRARIIPLLQNVQPCTGLIQPWLTGFFTGGKTAGASVSLPTTIWCRGWESM
jgi:hypothetical protein